MGEREWTEACLERIRGGAYSFLGEAAEDRCTRIHRAVLHRLVGA